MYDLALRILAGNSNCSTFVGNSALTGLDPYDGEDDLELTDGSEVSLDSAFAAAGICPRGQVNQVTDEYLNLATRTIEGMDVAIVYSLGDFTFKYNGSFTDEFDQEATSQFAAMQALADNGTIP